MDYILILNQMKRNRIWQLSTFKRGRQPVQRVAQTFNQIPWQSDYYHYKQQLSSIARKNQEIQYFLKQYQQNPSVFNLKQLQYQLTVNHRRVEQLSQWVNHFPYTHLSPPQSQLQINIVNHLKQQILKAVQHVFSVREQIQLASPQESSLALSQPHNTSYRSLNNSQIDIDDRNETINEMSAKIEHLTDILRRMGDVVQQQGKLVDRIDQQLASGHDHVRLGKQQLAARAARQTCTEANDDSLFGCASKVNTIITILYFVNLALIVALVAKNL